MNNKKIIIAVAAIGIAVATSVQALGATYVYDNLSGTNAQSGSVVIGQGTKRIGAECTNQSGTAYAKKIIRMCPDATVATVKVTSPRYGEASFYAEGINWEGEVQQYYVLWSGSAASKANVSLKD